MMEGFTYRHRTPTRGELIIFRTLGIPALNQFGDTVYLKRLIGMPGETIQIKDGKVYVNGNSLVFTGSTGEALHYTNAGALNTSAAKFRVPADTYFVLGDNSANSADSRYWGVVPAANIRGKMWFRYWPVR